MRQEDVKRYIGQSFSNETTTHEAPKIVGPTAQERNTRVFWQTLLGTLVFDVIKDLFGEESAEIAQAREESESALKADELARREVALIQNRLAACESDLVYLPHETSQAPYGSAEGAAIGNLREERERLLDEWGRLRIHLIEAKAYAAKVATNKRQETERFARRARQAHAQAKAKRGEVHDLLEHMFKEIDNQLGEAWFAALAFGKEVEGRELEQGPA